MTNKGGRPNLGRGNWPQLNVRLDPALHARVVAHLSDPLSLAKIPPKALAVFISTAIEHELERQCGTTSSPPSPQSKPTDLASLSSVTYF